MPKQISDAEILDAALQVIIEQGYTGATTRQIAAAANITELTLFRRFENKKKLVLAAIQQEVEKFTNEQIGYTGDLVADLAHVVDFYQELVAKRGRLLPVLLAELPRQPELWEALEGPKGLVVVIMQIVHRYQAEGQLVQLPPVNLVAGLLGPIMLAGIALHMLESVPAPRVDPREHVLRFLRGYGRDVSM
jgi:AcrR family transcriptional regulator